MALIYHKFNDPDTPLPSLADADEELWTEFVGDCLANWMQNGHDFFIKQQNKMKTVALEPFLFAVKAFLPQAWINVLVTGGVLSSDRISNLNALTEDEHYILGLAEQMFDRCAVLVNNKNDIKAILNFIHDVEERPRMKEGVVDVLYAEREVGELQIFKSLWAPIRRMYDKKKSQAKICVVYFFKIMHSQIVAYGCEGIDKIDLSKNRFLGTQTKLEGSYDSFNKAGGEEYKMENYKKAMSCYTQAAWRNPFNQACFGNRAQTHINLRDFWSALWDCKRALVRDPKNPKNCYRQARACVELGWLDEALDMNDKALKHCVDELQRKEIAKQKAVIEGHVKKRRESESESSGTSENKKTQPPVYNCQDSINLLSLIGDGCSHYDKGQYRSSLEVWAKALGFFHDLGLKRLQMSEEDLVMLKIFYGLALVKTGTFNNLISALDKFTALKSQSLHRVAVVYGFALIYFKLNRFAEALHQSRKGLKALEEEQEEGGKSPHPTCSWLSGCEMAAEVDKEELEKNLRHILKESSHPPKPDAVCRSHQNTHNPRLEMYLTDPDFKGLVRVQCRLRCCVEFHLPCWKTLKTNKHESRNDKSMLDSPCPTPDCGGLIHTIQVLKPDSGNPIELVSSLKPSPSPKPHKPVIKMKTDNLQKLKKRAEKKAVRKQRKLDKKTEEALVEEAEVPVEEEEGKKKGAIPKAGAKEPKLYTGEATLLVKDDSDEILKSKGKSSKNKKRKEKDTGPKPTVLPLDVKFKDEGRQLFGAQDFLDEPLVDASGLLPMPGTAPLPLGNGLLTVPSSIPYPPDELANTLFDLFEDILRAHGPQFIGSPFLQDIMRDFPEEAHRKIISYGGLYNFIYSNKKFDIIAGRFVCIREDAQKAMAVADLFFNGATNMPVNRGDGGFSAWAPVVPPGAVGPGAFSNPTPQQQLPPKPKPAFSWEQRARDIAAKLANSQSSSTSSPSVGNHVNVVPNITSSIIAADELPSLHEVSKRSRKQSSSEKTPDNAAVSSSTATTTVSKNVEDDDGFILITRGGGKKMGNNVSGSSSSSSISGSSVSGAVSGHSSAINSARNTPSPGINSVDGSALPAMKANVVDSGSKSRKDVSKGMAGKGLSSLQGGKRGEATEMGKATGKGKAKGVACLDSFDVPAPLSSSPVSVSNGELVGYGGTKSLSVETSSVVGVEKKVSGDSGGNVVAGNHKNKSLSNRGKDNGGSGGGCGSSSSTNLGLGKLIAGGGNGGGGVSGAEDNYDALSVMDSVDDIGDDGDDEDIRRVEGDDGNDVFHGVNRQQQQRQQYSAISTAMEAMKQQEDKSRAVPSQPEILSNLSALLAGGGSGGNINVKQQQQLRDSGTSSPLSLGEDGSQSALRCDSPALSQGSSESSSQSQPAPLKPLKGMAGGLGILSRNKKGKQRLTVAAPNKPTSCHNSLDNPENGKEANQQSSDLEADLSNFIYQSSSLPPPFASSKFVGEGKETSDIMAGGGSVGVDRGGSAGSNHSIKTPNVHLQRDLDSKRDSIKDDSPSFFNDNYTKDDPNLGENAIDPLVLGIFNQFNHEHNNTPSSFLSSFTYNDSMNQSLSEPLENSYLSGGGGGEDKQLGFSSNFTSLSEMEGMRNRDVVMAGAGAVDGSQAESLNVIGMGIPMRGGKLSTVRQSDKGFVTNGAGSGVVSSPPTDFLTHEDAIKKLWSSSSGSGVGDGGGQSTMEGVDGFGFESNFGNSALKKNTFEGENTLILSSSLQKLSSSPSYLPSSSNWSTDNGLASASSSSPSLSTVVFPSLHALSSPVPQPHLFNNETFFVSAAPDGNETDGCVADNFSKKFDEPHQQSNPFSTTTSSPSYYLSSQLNTIFTSVPTASPAASSSLWQAPPSSSLPSSTSSSSSSSFSTNTGSILMQLNSIFKPDKPSTSFTPTDNTQTSATNSDTNTIPTQPLQSSSSSLPSFSTNIENNGGNSTTNTSQDSQHTSSSHHHNCHHQFDEKQRSSPMLKNKGLLPEPNYLLPNPPARTNQTGLLPLPVPGGTGYPAVILNPDVPAYTPKLNPSHLSNACRDGLYEDPEDLARDLNSPYGNPNFLSNSNPSPMSHPNHKLPNDGLLENMEVPSIASSSLPSSRLNPNSREFQPTSSFFTALGMSQFRKETRSSSSSNGGPCSPTAACAGPAMTKTDTSCQTEKVKVDTASASVNTVFTLKMFGEMMEFIKHEARHSEDLKNELDREKAELKQTQAAECVLKRKLEENKELLEVERNRNEEMQKKLDRLTEEVHNLQGRNDDLSRTNHRLIISSSTTEKERDRAVIAEKKILQISSQLMGQRLEGKKTEALKHMAQLQNAFTSFTSKGLPVPQPIASKQTEWQEFVVKCDRQLDLLQNFFDQQIGQLSKGRLLKDLPEVSSKITVPEMPKPPSSSDISLPAADKAQKSSPAIAGSLPTAKEDNPSASKNAANSIPPGLKPLSKPLPAPLQPRLLQQQGGKTTMTTVGAAGGGSAVSNPFLKKLSQQLPQPSVVSSPSPPSSSSSSSSQPQSQQQTPFDKIVVELQKTFPILSREVIATFLEVVRRNNGGSFTNMTVSQVVAAFQDLMLGVSPLSGSSLLSPLSAASPFNFDDLPAASRLGSVSKDEGSGSVRSAGVKKGRVGGETEEAEEEDYDNFCPICHEDMDQSKARVLDCGHVFHEECIRRWFQQQRSCPNCREFSLLSDEFPSLK